MSRSKVRLVILFVLVSSTSTVCNAGPAVCFAFSEICHSGSIGGISCALLDGDNVSCWGSNQDGQLGYGHTRFIGNNEHPAAIEKINLGVQASQVLSSSLHSCIISVSDSIHCWGYNAFGQLGYGHTDNIGDDELPASVGDLVLGASNMASQVALAYYHTCVLFTSGGVRCWGNNASGQLGYGHTDNIGDDELPTANVNLGTGAISQIAAGGKHTCVLFTSGDVRCWGNNASGQLGYGHTDNIGDDELPTSNVNLGTGAISQIAAGEGHTCVLFTSGGVRCWGNNASGQLGYGHTDNIGDDELPTANVNLGTGAISQIAAGGKHTCVLFTSGDVRCWGNNASGQLGYGHTDNIGDDELPTSNVNLGTGAISQIAAGEGHTCVLFTTGGVRCWGSNYHGQLGYGHTFDVGDNEVPADVDNVNVGAKVRELWY